MSFDVKFTTKHNWFEVICPHYCVSCGEIGEILCECCRKHNSYEDYGRCLECGLVAKNGCCDSCRLPFLRGFVCGGRTEMMGELVKEYKYKSIRAFGLVFARIIDDVLPCLPAETVIVPVPTIAKHVRQRGLDHTLLVSKKLAKIRGWKVRRIVERAKDTVQVGATEEVRRKQAEKAYKMKNGKDKISYPVLVIDDVWTTGASMKAVCNILREAGAEDITICVLAR